MRKRYILCAMRDFRVAQWLIRRLDDGERCMVRVVGNGDAVIDSVLRAVPDILVIDAILPHLDGLGVIDKLRIMLGERMPRVIGGTMMSFSDDGFRRRGVKWLVHVPWNENELEQAIGEALRELDTQVDWLRIAPGSERAGCLLEQLGMKKTLRGFSYLSWAAALVWDDETRMFAIGARLYRPIAAHFGTTPQSVERLIRHALESTMDAVGAHGVYGFFGNTIDPTRGKPTNAQMIGMLAQRMRVERPMTRAGFSAAQE